MRRVATIALVHETLSQTLDETRRRSTTSSAGALRLAADVAAAGAHGAAPLVRGRSGRCRRRTRRRSRWCSPSW